MINLIKGILGLKFKGGKTIEEAISIIKNSHSRRAMYINSNTYIPKWNGNNLVIYEEPGDEIVTYNLDTNKLDIDEMDEDCSFGY